MENLNVIKVKKTQKIGGINSGVKVNGTSKKKADVGKDIAERGMENVA